MCGADRLKEAPIAEARFLSRKMIGFNSCQNL